MTVGRMVLLTTVSSEFHGRVLAARLGTEGVLAQLRGAVGGPYPMGEVLIYVPEDELAVAREILVVDQAAAVLDESGEVFPAVRPVASFRRWVWPVLAVLVLVLSDLLYHLG